MLNHACQSLHRRVPDAPTRRQALRHWSNLQQRWRRAARRAAATPGGAAAPPGSAGQLQAAAAEDAAWLLYRLGRQHELDSLLLEEEIEEKEREIQVRRAARLAGRRRRLSPGLTPVAQAGRGAQRTRPAAAA